MPMTIHGRATCTANEPSRASYAPDPCAGEPPHVPHYWQRALAGFADVDLLVSGSIVSAFELTPDDWRRWPALAGWPVLALWDDVSGVVHSRTMLGNEYQAWRAAHDGCDE